MPRRNTKARPRGALCTRMMRVEGGEGGMGRSARLVGEGGGGDAGWGRPTGEPERGRESVCSAEGRRAIVGGVVMVAAVAVVAVVALVEGVVIWEKDMVANTRVGVG